MRIRRVVAIAIVAGSACVASYASREQEVVATDITSYDFGVVPVGQGSTSATVTIAPQTQADDDNVTAIGFQSLCPDFTLNLSQQLPAHIYCENLAMARVAAGSGTQSCIPHIYPFTATFTPSFAGLQSCNVKIDYTPAGSGGAGGSTYVMLSGSGMSTANAWTVSPAQLPFGDVPVTQTSAAQIVTVTNTGTQSIDVTSSNSNGTVFVVTGPTGAHSLAAGSAEQYSIQCTPSSATLLSGTLTFAGPTVPSKTVMMSCRGITTTLSVTNPVVFAYTLVGRAPLDKTVTIANTGSASVTVSNFRLGSGASTDLSIAAMPPTSSLGMGSSVPVILHFAATKPNAGSLGTLTFDTGSASSQSVAVSGDAQVGSIGTNPASLEFGPVCVGAMATHPLAIYANAPGRVDVSSVAAPATAQLSVSATSGTLQGNHANELVAMATLTGGTPGMIDDKVTINSNLPAQPAIDVPVHAVVVPAGVAASPNLVHFGPVMTDTTTTAKEIVITNCGSGPLVISGASVAGADASEFAIVSPANPARTLAAAESMSFLVVMSPHARGMKSAQLVVAHGQGTTTADLDGNGYSGSDSPDPKDRETYYACSAGGSAGAWPILVALLALRRRRK